MTIEFDDAGGGCPILGEAFIAHRLETGEYFFGYVQPNISNKNAAILKTLYELLSKMAPTENEEVIMCQGNVFTAFHNDLRHNKKHGFKLITKRERIVGLTNDLVENFFIEKLYNYGVPTTITLDGKNYAEFYQSVLVWYNTLSNKYDNQLKDSFKSTKHYRNYLHYCIYDYPLLMAELFKSNE